MNSRNRNKGCLTLCCHLKFEDGWSSVSGPNKRRVGAVESLRGSVHEAVGDGGCNSWRDTAGEEQAFSRANSCFSSGLTIYQDLEKDLPN